MNKRIVDPLIKFLRNADNGTWMCDFQFKHINYASKEVAYSKAERFAGITEKEKRAAMKLSISDSAQYKLAGNSIVVDVLYHLFRKMFVDTENENPQMELF